MAKPLKLKLLCSVYFILRVVTVILYLNAPVVESSRIYFDSNPNPTNKPYKHVQTFYPWEIVTDQNSESQKVQKYSDYEILDDCDFYYGYKSHLCKLRDSRKSKSNGNSVRYYHPYELETDSGQNGHQLIITTVPSEDFTKPGFKQKEFLWRKRMKSSSSLVFPITIFGLPLLWTFVLSILIKDHLQESREMNMMSMKPNKMPNSQMMMSRDPQDWQPHPSPMENGPKDRSKEMMEKKEDDEINDAADSIAFTKEVIKIATQSFHLASNTVELFNILRGVDSGSDNGGSNGDGGRNTATNTLVNRNGDLISDTETYSNIRIAAKFLQLSSTIVFLVVQFLGF